MPLTFPSAQSAVDWIRGKLTQFDQTGEALRTDLIRVGRMIATAKAKQQPLGQLRDLQIKIRKTLTDHINLETKLSPFREYFGLGLLPVAIAIAAIPVAGVLYLHFQKAATHRKSLEMIERGLMTVGEAKAIAAQPMLGLGLGTGLPLIALGIGILFLIRR